MPAWGFGHVDRLRRRLAWLLIRPYMQRRANFYAAQLKAHAPPDDDWWMAKYSGLWYLRSDLRAHNVDELPASTKGSY
jgi:hypothetical protein